MTPTYLLDTNVLSEPLRPAPNSGVLDGLRTHQAELAIPSVVWHELWYGCRRLAPSTRRSAIEAYLREVVARSLLILAYDDRAADWHAEERARLTAHGQTPPFADGQIAAIAAVNDLILVTANTADYRAFRGLRLADWRTSE